MIIEKGYWNYYMSFHLADNKKLFYDIMQNKYSDSVIGVALDNEILENASFKEYFEERRKTMTQTIAQKHSEKWDENTEKQLYFENKLPEYYFDFTEIEGQWKDTLELAWKENVAEIHEINKVFNCMIGEINKGRWTCMALMPLKIELKPFIYEYCSVFIYLFENGYGVIKISIKLSDVESSSISAYPMKTWFGEVKAWQPLMDSCSEKEFKIYKDVSNKKSISIITYILQNFVYRLFSGNLLDKKRFSCFETFVIAAMKPKQLWEINNKGSIAEKAELYSLANPENFMVQITSERWYEFWKKSYLNLNGFDMLTGNNCRLIISIDSEMLKKTYHRENIVDFNSYLQVSLQRSFDLFLTIPLCQKDSEFYLYRVSEMNMHSLDKEIAIYNANQNFFEGFLDVVSYNARVFYFIIKEINDKSFPNVNTRIERLKQIETYQGNIFTEKKTLLLEVVALIASILFGLPMIYETMSILRAVFLPPGDLVTGEIIRILSVSIWLSIILIMSIYLRIAYKKYRTRKL